MAVRTGAQKIAVRWPPPEVAARKVALVSQLAVIFEHRSGAALMAVSTGAQKIAVRWPPERLFPSEDGPQE